MEGRNTLGEVPRADSAGGRNAHDAPCNAPAPEPDNRVTSNGPVGPGAHAPDGVAAAPPTHQQKTEGKRQEREGAEEGEEENGRRESEEERLLDQDAGAESKQSRGGM